MLVAVMSCESNSIGDISMDQAIKLFGRTIPVPDIQISATSRVPPPKSELMVFFIDKLFIYICKMAIQVNVFVSIYNTILDSLFLKWNAQLLVLLGFVQIVSFMKPASLFLF